MPSRCLAWFLSLLAALAVPAGGAAAYQCQEQVERALQQSGVQLENVTSVEVVRRSRGANPAGNYALDAWARLGTCSNGAVVVHMTRYCFVQDVYTTGDCRAGDLPNY